MENPSYQSQIVKSSKPLVLALATVLSSCAPRLEMKILWTNQNPIIVENGWFEKVLNFFTQNFSKNISIPKDAIYNTAWNELISIYNKNQPRLSCWASVSNITPAKRNFWASGDFEKLTQVFEKNWINIKDEIVFQSWEYKYYVKLGKLDNNYINFCSIVRK